MTNEERVVNAKAIPAKGAARTNALQSHAGALIEGDAE
jgi:hypothetical protein